MALLPPCGPAGLRLSCLEYIDTTPGPEWKSNSCWMDTALWIAKVTGLTQHIQDEGAAANDALRERVWALLRSNWRRLGRESLSKQRDMLLADYSKQYKKVKGGFGNLREFLEFMCAGVPTVTLNQSRVTRCKCRERARSSSMPGIDVPSYGVDEYLGKTASGATLTNVLEAVFGWRYTGDVCEGCHTDKSTVMSVEKEMPPLLLLFEPALKAVASQGQAPIDIVYRSAPSLEKRTAHYKIRAVALHTGKHFFGLVPSRPPTTGHGAYCWDGMEDSGKVQHLAPAALKARLEGSSGSRLYTSVVVLERIG